MSQQPPPLANVFDAAKAIVTSLTGLDKQAQQQAIKFASESLGLGTVTPPTSSTTVAATPAIIPNQQNSAKQPTDIRQFTDSKSPKSDQQFAAVAAYYYRFVAPENERHETINVEELKNAAREAGRRVPSKFVLNNAKNSGFVNSVGNGNYKLTTVGENLVAMTLPGNGSGTPKRIRQKKAGKKSSTAKKPKDQK